MARHLHLITSLVSLHLKHRFVSGVAGKDKLSRYGKEGFPASVELAILQGEALLRLEFFAYLKQRGISDSDNLIKLWQQLVVNRQFIQQIAEQGGLADYFKLDKSMNNKLVYQEQCYIAYCVLVFDAKCCDNHKLLLALTKGLVVHFMPTLFPEQAKVKDIKVLKREIIKLLVLRGHESPNLKESFVTTEDKVVFTLFCKVAKQELLPLMTIEGRRLKSTRLKCYKAVLKQLM